MDWKQAFILGLIAPGSWDGNVEYNPTTVLMAADGYILLDSNGVYLIPKEE